MENFRLNKPDLAKLRVFNNPGIYAICNIKNGKRYIGSSFDVNRRVKKHLRSLRKGIHDNEYLQRAFDKYGEDAFEIHLLQECDEENVLVLEVEWMRKYKSAQREYGYNLTEDPSRPGRLCKEAREKISRQKSGSNHHFWGKSLSDEHKLLVSESLIGNKRALGTKHSEETKEKVSAASKAFWEGLSEKEKIDLGKKSGLALRKSKIFRHKPTENNPYPGVYTRNDGRTYYSQLRVDGKIKRLGTFKDKEKARETYLLELERVIL